MTSSLSRSPMPARREALTLEIIRDEAGFHALEPFWDTLVDQMATRTPFVRWDWVSLWWEECRDDAKLAIIVLRGHGGVLQAIAPLMLAREQDQARRHLVTLAFLGGFGEARGERLDFIVPAGREDELAPQLCQAFKELRPECDVVRLNALPQESGNTPHILAALGDNFIRAGVLNRHGSRFITLPGTWGEIEARHSSSWRGNLRRNCRTFEKDHGGVVTMSGDHRPHLEAFERMRCLHDANLPAEASTFTTPSSLRFHRRLAGKWLPEGRAILPLLESQGIVVSAIYGFIDRGEFFLYQMGWDDTLARLSPGKMAMRWSIINAMQRHARVYDMLPGEYEYKRQWGDSTRWVLDLEAANPSSWRASVFHALRTVRRRFSVKPIPEGLAA